MSVSLAQLPYNYNCLLHLALDGEFYKIVILSHDRSDVYTLLSFAAFLSSVKLLFLDLQNHISLDSF